MLRLIYAVWYGPTLFRGPLAFNAEKRDHYLKSICSEDVLSHTAPRPSVSYAVCSPKVVGGQGQNRMRYSSVLIRTPEATI